MQHNVSLRVIDTVSKQVVANHVGHNAATNSMLLGMAHYLAGSGIYNQAPGLLVQYVPKFISLGTMGLCSQEADELGLPAGIGIHADDTEEQRFKDYMSQIPGFGADGYSAQQNNNRLEFGLGPMYEDRLGGKPSSGNDDRPTINCELISLRNPRAAISYRDVVPESESEVSGTIDVVFSAMISTGALRQFREPGKDYIFITEAGLWSQRDFESSGENGLLAAYRIAPPDSYNWDMSKYENREILKRNVLRVGTNQVVQVIWKVQIGAIEQLTSTVIQPATDKVKWILWGDETSSDDPTTPIDPTRPTRPTPGNIKTIPNGFVLDNSVLSEPYVCERNFMKNVDPAKQTIFDPLYATIVNENE